MKAIITVVVSDKVMLLWVLVTKVADSGLNIDDILKQSLMNSFTMMVVVSSEGKQTTHLRAELEAFGESLNVKINIQSSAIFDAMHKLVR